jgi:hypothetical protein
MEMVEERCLPSTTVSLYRGMSGSEVSWSIWRGGLGESEDGSVV